MNNDVSELLQEFKSLRKKIEANATVVLVVIIILAASSIYQNHFSSARNRDRRQEDNWRSASNEMDMLEFDKAAAIVQRLIDKNPNYYYGYSFLGYIALQKNELKEAEKQFARAYQLFPTSDNEQKLQAVQKRLAAETLK
jgi:cytochrome c-type biogenesis protein CcmH/NrfG